MLLKAMRQTIFGKDLHATGLDSLVLNQMKSCLWFCLNNFIGLSYLSACRNYDKEALRAFFEVVTKRKINQENKCAKYKHVQ